MFGKTHVPSPRTDDKILTLKEEANLIIWDASHGSTAEITLTGNRTLIIRNFVDGQPLNLFVVQDATGSRTLTFESTLTVRWPAASPPGWSTTASSIDMVSILPRTKVLYATLLKAFG
jgi:hypothetical protein